MFRRGRKDREGMAKIPMWCIRSDRGLCVVWGPFGGRAQAKPDRARVGRGFLASRVTLP